MLKFLFWFLLLGNVVLFAFHQGYMEALSPDGREPGRTEQQLNADKIELLPAEEAGATSDGGSTSDANAAAAAVAPEMPVDVQPVVAVLAAAAPDTMACTELGNFDTADAKQFEQRVAALALGSRLSQRPVRDGGRHIVFIPAQGSKEGAEKKASELRNLGVKDFYIIQDKGDHQWGISLGIFRAEEAARAYLVTLSQKGVRSARLGPYNAPSSKVAFQLRGLDPTAKKALDKIRLDFPRQQMRDCAAA